MVTGCCYKMMENPSIGALKNKSLWEALSHLLGVAVKRSNDTLSKLLTGANASMYKVML